MMSANHPQIVQGENICMEGSKKKGGRGEHGKANVAKCLIMVNTREGYKKILATFFKV